MCSTTCREADFGERCFLSSCLLQLCPRCWRSLRISWLAAGIYLAGAEKKLAWLTASWCWFSPSPVLWGSMYYLASIPWVGPAHSWTWRIFWWATSFFPSVPLSSCSFPSANEDGVGKISWQRPMPEKDRRSRIGCVGIWPMCFPSCLSWSSLWASFLFSRNNEAQFCHTRTWYAPYIANSERKRWKLYGEHFYT